MVELLIAVAVSGLLTAALVTSMSESMRLANFGQNQIMAVTIVQEQIDSTRSTPYDSLLANQGDMELKVTNAVPYGKLVPVIAPRPLLLDSSKFDGRAFETIAPGPYPDTLTVTVTVSWMEDTFSRNYSLSTLVARSGLNSMGTISGAPL